MYSILGMFSTPYIANNAAPGTAETALAALYLAGAPRPNSLRRAAWSGVCGCLLRAACDLGAAPAVLRKAGYWCEALALETPGLIAWAEDLLARGDAVTSVSVHYPARWLRLPSPPPALYCRGVPPTHGTPSLSVVGSRHVPPHIARFAADVGRIASMSGLTVVSGGAAGCDRASVSLASPTFEVLPCGIGAQRPSARWSLSARAPGEPFSSAAAMERNTLIYAASEWTVVVQARHMAGGTWAGATEALRRRLGRLIVRQDPCEPGLRALIALGGVPLESADQLAGAMAAPAPQAGLFAPQQV